MLPDRIAAGLSAAAGRPLALWLAVAALDAVFNPYCGLYHDARLYAFQAANRAAGGAFAHDLFFKFGSQDQFSAFSPVFAPLVRAVGVEPAFVLGYLVAKGLFWWAAVRVALAVVPDPRAAVAGVAAVAVLDVPYAGLDALYLNEPFLTARLPAVALGLLAVAELLAGRPVRAAGLAAAGCVFHPLMGAAALGLVAGSEVVRRAGRPAVAALAAVGGLAGVGLLLSGSVADRVLGTMDAEWRELVRLTTPYNFPAEWAPADWIGAAAAAGVLLAAARRLDPLPARVLVLAVVIGLAGLAAAVAAPHLPYARPLQVQAYRAGWPMRLLAVPAGVWLAAEWWRSGRRVGAIAVVLLLFAPRLASPPGWFALAVLPVAAVGFRGLGRRPRRPDWFAAALVAWAVAGVAVSQVMAAGFLWAFWPGVRQSVEEPWLLTRYVLNQVEPVLKVAAAVALAGLAGGWAARTAAGRFVLAAVAVGVPVGSTAFRQTDAYRAWDRNAADVRFVAGVIGSPPAPPTVYWPTGLVHRVWLDLRAASFYEWPSQTAGNVFSRPQAVEGYRRGQAVRAFEAARWKARPQLVGGYAGGVLDRTYPGWRDDPPPTADDLIRLVRAEPGIDWVVLPYHFPGLPAATNGSVWVYDARQIRHDPPDPPPADR